jgi:hypothetical protein
MGRTRASIAATAYAKVPHRGGGAIRSHGAAAVRGRQGDTEDPAQPRGDGGGVLPSCVLMALKQCFVEVLGRARRIERELGNSTSPLASAPL